MPRLNMTRRGLALAGAAFFAGKAVAQTAPSAPSAPQSLKSAQALADAAPPIADSLAIALDQAQRMTTEVYIDGQGPYPFLVDTGADHSVISADLAATLQLPPGPKTTVHGVAGDILAASVIAGAVQVGARRISNLALPLLQQANLGAAGVLGIDAVQDQQVQLDFAQRRILVQPSVKRRDRFDEITVRAHSRFGQLVLVDAALGDDPVLVVVDTGAETTIANNAFRLRAGLARPDRVADRTDIFSVTGQTTTGGWATVKAVRVGGFKIANLPVVFSDLESFDRWQLRHQPALLLGMDVLRKFDRVSIDFPRREVRFQGLHAEQAPPDFHSIRLA